MFKDVAELKNFIVWAKKQGIQKAKIGDIEFEVSIVSQAIDYQASEEKTTSKTMVDTEKSTKEEEDELLFWSAN